MATPRDIQIVTVAFNSTGVIGDMLASVPKGTPVVIVDNASTDRAALEALAQSHDAQIVSNATNRGFGVACNIGAAIGDSEWILFLNPDSVLSEGALDHLISATHAYPTASAFNPRIALANGAPQFKRKSHLIDPAQKLPRGWPDTDRDVPVLSGAALMVRRSAFMAVGGFDPAIFLYHEDDDLAVRLRRDCGPLMFVHAALVTHLSGESTVRSPEIAALKAWHMARSRVYATAKHGQPAASLWVILAALGQLMSPAILLSARKRAKQMAFLRGAVSTLRDGGVAQAPAT